MRAGRARLDGGDLRICPKGDNTESTLPQLRQFSLITKIRSLAAEEFHDRDGLILDVKLSTASNLNRSANPKLRIFLTLSPGDLVIVSKNIEGEARVAYVPRVGFVVRLLPTQAQLWNATASICVVSCYLNIQLYLRSLKLSRAEASG